MITKSVTSIYQGSAMTQISTDEVSCPASFVSCLRVVCFFSRWTCPSWFYNRRQPAPIRQLEPVLDIVRI